MLRNRDDHRLVVGRRVDRAHAVGSCGDTGGNVHGEDTVNSSSIDTLEEEELLGVSGRDLVQRRESLDDLNEHD